MRRLLSSKSPLVAGAIPCLIWVAGAPTLGVDLCIFVCYK